MGVPVMADTLSALANVTWAESFQFCLGTEHKPDAFDAGDTFEIALKRRGSSDATTRLTTAAGGVVADIPGGNLAANWAPPVAQADRVGVWDFQIRRFGAGGVIEPLLLGTVEFVAGL